MRLTQTWTNSSNPAIALTGDTIHVVFCDDSTGVSQVWYLRSPGGSTGMDEEKGVGRGAWDEHSGLLTPSRSLLSAGAIIRDILYLPREPGTRATELALLDITGRRAAWLHPGRNDLSMLRGGVYFIKPAKRAPATKIVVIGARTHD